MNLAFAPVGDHLRIFAPSVSAHDEVRVYELRNRLIDLCGGITMYDMVGSWRNPDTNRIEDEEGKILDIHFESNPSLDLEVLKVIQKWAEDSNQHTVGLELNGKLHLVPTSEMAGLRQLFA